MAQTGFGVLMVPVEVIPKQISIEQFLEGWKNKDPKIMKIIETECKYVDISSI